MSTTPESSSTGVTTYTPGTFPSNVTSTQSVECFAGNIVNSLSGTFPTNFQGGETIDFPNTVWQTQVGSFGPGLFGNDPFVGVYFPVNIGLVDTVGTASTPTITSPIASNFYATFVVLQAIISALSGTGAVSASPTILIPQFGTGTFPGAGIVISAPTLIYSPVSSLLGTGNAISRVTELSSAASSGTGSISNVSSVLHVVATPSAGTSQIMAQPSGSISPGISLLKGTGNVASNATFISSTTITANGSASAYATSAPSSTITGTANVSGIFFLGIHVVITLSGAGTVSANPAFTIEAYAVLSGQAGTGAIATSGFIASAYMNAIFQMWTSPPTISHPAATSISAAGTFSVRPVISSSHPILNGTGVATAYVYLIQRGKATSAGLSNLLAGYTILTSVTKHGRSKLVATPYVTPTPVMLIRGSGTLLAKTFFLAVTHKSVTWNTRGKVPVSQAVSWNTTQRVTTSKALTWNLVRAHIARLQGQGNVSNVFPPKAVLSGVGKVSQPIAHITRQLNVSWNTRMRVAFTSKSLTWNTAGLIKTNIPVTWNIVRPPVVRLQGQGSIAIVSSIQRPQALLNGLGNVKAKVHVTKTLGVSWNTRVKVPVTKAMTWNTIGHIDTTRRITWNTTMHIDPGVHITWNTNTLVVATNQAMSWNTLKKVTTSLHCTWNSHGLIKASKQLRWNTEQTINTTRALSWNTHVKINPSLHITFNDTGRLKSHQAMKWSMVETSLLSGTSLMNMAEHLSVGKSVTWNTRARISGSQIVNWNDLYRIDVFSILRWNTGGHLFKYLPIRWNTRTGPIQTSLDIGWFIDQPDIVFPATGALGSCTISGTSVLGG